MNKKNILYITIVSTLFICMSFGVYNIVGSKDHNFFTETNVDFPIKGIDVSHYQGDISWDKVKNDNVSFAFIKATEGATFRDKKYIKNYKNAKKNGIVVGAYHFYKASSTPFDQFKNFSKVVKKEGLDLPPVIDLEYHTNNSLRDPKNKDKFIKNLKIFNKMIIDHYGVAPIFYTNIYFYNNLLKNDFDNLLWICDYSKNSPEYISKGKWVFWQHSYTGKVNGIKNTVDLNVFHSDTSEFKKLILLNN